MNPVSALKGLYSFVTLVRDPNKLGEVFDLETVVSETHLEEMAKFFRQDAVGKKAMQERYRVGALNLDTLAAFPEGSLGRAFAEHMRASNLDPAALPMMKSDTENEFVIAHLYETHDIWHVVTGFGVDVKGELGLQAFYLAQFPAALAVVILAAGLFNTVLYRMDERDPRMTEIVRGYWMGKRAKSLFGVKWNDLWSTPLRDVRAMLRIESLGVVPMKNSQETASMAA